MTSKYAQKHVITHLTESSYTIILKKKNRQNKSVVGFIAFHSTGKECDIRLLSEH